MHLGGRQVSVPGAGSPITPAELQAMKEAGLKPGGDPTGGELESAVSELFGPADDRQPIRRQARLIRGADSRANSRSMIPASPSPKTH